MKLYLLLILIPMLFSEAASAADINITADKRVEWHQKSQKMVAIGNAVATKEDMSVLADTLTGYYTNSQTNSKGKISRIIANGNVKLKNPQAQAFGDNLDYDLSKEEAILIGKPAKIDTGIETITADENITYYPSQQKAIALGNVITIDKDKNELHSDKLIAYFSKENEKSKNITLQKVDIFGNIKIITKDATVTSDKGTYLPQSGKVYLFNDVTIDQKGNILRGDKAETNLNTGISKLISTSPQKRVKGVFKEKK